jgi:hypothetical protein
MDIKSFITLGLGHIQVFNMSSTVVEHSSHLPKVVGSSPAPVAS